MKIIIITMLEIKMISILWMLIIVVEDKLMKMKAKINNNNNK